MLHFKEVKLQLGLVPLRCNLTHSVYSAAYGLVFTVFFYVHGYRLDLIPDHICRLVLAGFEVVLIRLV